MASRKGNRPWGTRSRTVQIGAAHSGDSARAFIGFIKDDTPAKYFTRNTKAVIDS